MPRDYMFSSESVSEGHPDKLADQVSDAVLDAYLAQDPMARVACETMLAKNLVIVAGEMSSSAEVDYEHKWRGLPRRRRHRRRRPGHDVRLRRG